MWQKFWTRKPSDLDMDLDVDKKDLDVDVAKVLDMDGQNKKSGRFKALGFEYGSGCCKNN